MLAVEGPGAAPVHVAGCAFRGLVAWILRLVSRVARLIGVPDCVLVLVARAWNDLAVERAVRV